MKPHDQTKSRSGLAKARLLITTEVAWLEGFPSDRGWTTVPKLGLPIQTLPLEPERLSRTTRTLKRLRRDFPRALPRIVGNVDDWIERHLEVLDALKPFVHNKVPLPVDPFVLAAHPALAGAKKTALDLGVTRPELLALVRAVGWHSLVEPARANACLVWMVERSKTLSLIAQHLDGSAFLEVALRAFQLSEDSGSQAMDQILSVLADPHLHRLDPPEAYLHALRLRERHDVRPHKRRARTSPPWDPLAVSLLAVVHRAATEAQRTRRRVIRLLGLLLEEYSLEDWALWWAEIQTIERKLENPALDPDSRIHAKDALVACHDRAPPSTGRGFHSALEVSSPASKIPYDTLRATLARFPTSALGRPRIRAEILGLICEQVRWDEPKLLQQLLLAMADHLALRSDDLESAAHAWTVDRKAKWDMELGSTLMMLPKAELIRPVVSELASLENTTSFAGHEPVRFVRLVINLESLEAGAAVYRQLGALGRINADGWSIHLAALITRPSFEHLGSVLEWLDHHAEAHGLSEDIKLEQVVERALCGGDGPLALLELEAPEVITEFLRAARLGAALADPDKKSEIELPRFSRPEPSPLAPWMTSYPPRFHARLRALAAADPNAEQTAARALRAAFPTPEQLQTQLKALDAKWAESEGPQKTALGKRRANLLRRCESPPELREATLLKLDAKLQRLSLLRRIEIWEQSLHETIDAALRSACPAAPADWAQDPRLRLALPHVLNLAAATQKLANCLFEARAGSKPWDLRTAPENQEFVARMERRGLRLAPWLDEAPVQALELDGQTITFALEEDPYEIFLMGHHFQTCLSPGEFNYFSVFANAADLNKRVLFGRRTDGTVLARVLLAITNDGLLMAFQPYCHLVTDQLAVLVGGYLRSLASAMQTTVTSFGRVSPLVARTWYDDGPYDLSGSFDCLLEDSAFRKSIAEVDAKAFVPKARDAMQTERLTPVHVQLILYLPELHRRPELAHRLLSELDSVGRLDPHAATRAVQLLHQSGASTEAYPELLEKMGRAFTRNVYGYRRFDSSIALVLLEADPQRLLRLLRSIRRVDHLYPPEQSRFSALFGLALERLLRPKQARARLLEALVEPEWLGDLETPVREALKRLG